MAESDIFDDIYWNYTKQVAEKNLLDIAPDLGVTVEGDTALTPLFGRTYRISGGGVVDGNGNRPSHSVSVVLLKYLLTPSTGVSESTEWVSYKDFPHAAPFAGGFLNNVERPIGGKFSGAVPALQRASEALGGRIVNEQFPGDLVVRFDGLPRIPLLMVFHDGDEEFPPHCSVLFERQAARYLDMECLAILGWILAEWLIATLPQQPTEPS